MPETAVLNDKKYIFFMGFDQSYNLILHSNWEIVISIFQLKVVQEHKGQRSLGSLSVAAEVISVSNF